MTLLAACLLLAGAGCGTDDQPSARDRGLARASLLTQDDLPKRALPADDRFGRNECNPVRNFKEHGGAVANAPRYVVKPISFLHTAGIFDSDDSAETALEDFTSKENNACVLARMQQRALEQTGREASGRMAPVAMSMPSGFDGSAMRFTVASVAKNKDDRLYFDTIAMRHGRGIVVVGYYASDVPAPLRLRQRLQRLATRQLASALDRP